MRRLGDDIVFSPTDLVGFLDCPHLTALDRAVFAGILPKPFREDAELDLLRRKGLEHERRYLEALAAEGHTVTEIADESGRTKELLAAREETLAAMRRGDDVIYQATFVEERWSGKADFLRRIDRPAVPSALGDWVYEPEDTKLALSAKASALLQLLTYARMLEVVQGEPPERIHVVLGRAEQTRATFRVADFAAYHRLVSGRFVDTVTDGPPPTAETAALVVDPTDHCAVCAWSEHCSRLRYRAGHLSRVAFIRRDEIEKLRLAGVPTIQALAALGPTGAASGAVDGLATDTLGRLQDQAAMQLEEERTKVRTWRILDHPLPETIVKDDGSTEESERRGLWILPAPSALDVFFDFEGDRFALDDGLEYLFGYAEAPALGAPSEGAPYTPIWAHDRPAEKQALETFIDYVMERRRLDPGMHVYHYAPYEPATLHRLTQRHGTRQEEVDVLLRAGVFVDLYRVVRQGMRISAESYSIKRMEPLYALTRDPDGIAQALNSMLAYEQWLETGDQAMLDGIATYNREDCLSTLMLRDWLEERRAELVVREGTDPGRPGWLSGAPREDLRAEDAEAAAIRARLMEGIDPKALDTDELPPEQQARRLLANLLGWHRREDRADWFEWYRLCDLDADDLTRDATPIGGVRYVGQVGTEARSTLHRWTFDPAQETKLKRGESAVAAPGGRTIGTIQEIDLDDGWLDIKVGPKTPQDGFAEIVGFIPPGPVPTKKLKAAILALGRWVADEGVDSPAPDRRAIRDILLGLPPRTVGTPRPAAEAARETGPALALPREEPGAAARRIALALDHSYVPIQGPPGSGKTYLGARIVTDIVRAGRAAGAPRTVGIAAFSHAAIGTLLEAVVEHAGEKGIPLRILQKADEHHRADVDGVEWTNDNATVEARLHDGSVDIVAGTAWFWARERAAGTLDTLVVDEAGQVSLANLVAMSGAAENIVLLGDPQQLSQPVKGAHPPGAEKSALEHILGQRQAIPPDRGIFLAETRRLHPEIAAFTSELFYDGKLRTLEGLELQSIVGAGAVGGVPDPLGLDRVGSLLAGSGLRWIPVEHTGRANSSPEEVDVVADLVSRLLGQGWIDAKGVARSIEPKDVIVVSPYNVQVGRLGDALPDGILVGTVDKIQGREAPVVIYSMATSTPDDMPRDMSFLFSLNRFNVATSRARALVVLVCNPALLTVRCRTPEQMRLANAMARFVELANGTT
jgi:predicted RecB family nuclease